MIILSVLLIGLLVSVDQYTKAKARNGFDYETRDFAFVKLSLVKNKGAFRGLLKKHPIVLVFLQIIGVLFVLVLLIIQLFVKKDKILIIGLSFICSGAIGNLYDRLTKGFVTDFFAIKWTKNLYYNLADMFIFLGAILTLIRGNKL